MKFRQKFLLCISVIIIVALLVGISLFLANKNKIIRNSVNEPQIIDDCIIPEDCIDYDENGFLLDTEGYPDGNLINTGEETNFNN